MVNLFLKDEHSMNLGQVYKLHYYSQINEESPDNDADEESTVSDAQLFRMKPCNLYQDAQKQQKIKDYLNLLS